MGRIVKLCGVLLICSSCFFTVGASANTGHEAVAHHAVENTLPGVRVLGDTKPPLDIFTPAKTDEPPMVAIAFPMIAAALGVLLAFMSRLKRPEC